MILFWSALTEMPDGLFWHTPALWMKGVLASSDLSRTLHESLTEWFMGWQAENQSWGGVLLVAGSFDVQWGCRYRGVSQEIPPLPCAAAIFADVSGQVPGSPAAQSSFESPFSNNFSRSVGIVRYWHLILLIKSFKYIFIKEAFSLLLHGEGHASVWPEHPHFEMFCPYNMYSEMSTKLMTNVSVGFWQKFSFQKESTWTVRDSGRYLIPHSILHHRLFTEKV